MPWRIEAMRAEALGASDGEPWEVRGLGHNSRAILTHECSRLHGEGLHKLHKWRSSTETLITTRPRGPQRGRRSTNPSPLALVPPRRPYGRGPDWPLA